MRAALVVGIAQTIVRAAPVAAAIVLAAEMFREGQVHGTAAPLAVAAAALMAAPLGPAAHEVLPAWVAAAVEEVEAAAARVVAVAEEVAAAAVVAAVAVVVGGSEEFLEKRK